GARGRQEVVVGRRLRGPHGRVNPATLRLDLRVRPASRAQRELAGARATEDGVRVGIDQARSYQAAPCIDTDSARPGLAGAVQIGLRPDPDDSPRPDGDGAVVLRAEGPLGRLAHG